MRTLEELLQTNKRTGEIKTLPFPIYRGVNLCDVYEKWSNLKQTGIIYCYDLLHSFKPDRIIACGGSWMVKDDLIKGRRFEEIRRLTEEAVQLVASIRRKASEEFV